MTVEKLVGAICARNPNKTEATLQAEIRQLLLTAPVGLDDADLQMTALEAPVGDRRRIDIELGSCVIEVKKDLSRPSVAKDAVEQLEGYLEARTAQTGLRYVGLLTDGKDWSCYHMRAAGAARVSLHTVEAGAEGAAALIAWLEGVLATSRDVAPTPSNIASRLGAGTSSHELDYATLATLYDDHKTLPTVSAKRNLWARLLTTALGTHFEDRDELFVQHSLLVLSAEIIAHAVLGVPLQSITPEDLVTGSVFGEAGVLGVVESDFFDWVVEVPGGTEWVRTLSRRLDRFRWGAVEHDVLKVLYESVIPASTRKKLGEYYTPDWLAEIVVSEVVEQPLSTRVLDPACGSGTFLFYCVRRYLEAADKDSVSPSEAIEGVTRSVIGMDLHPVAVTLARVTYLLAIGRERLSGERGSLRIPVYLGDSLQWQMVAPNLWTQGNLTVRTDSAPNLFDSELLFPEELLEQPHVFDELVEILVSRASEREPRAEVPSLEGVFERFGVGADDRSVLQETFEKLCHLSDEGRDHIWSYYIRNLARPTWLSRPENRVDALIGNPPWLAFRYMTDSMQEVFRGMADTRGLWHGATVATHQDLSALFVARTVELYLNVGGAFGLVLPNASLDRAQFRGFRSGNFEVQADGPVAVTFYRPWDLRRLRPHFFPRGAAVVFGRRSTSPGAMPGTAEAWSGRIQYPEAGWDEVGDALIRERADLHPAATVTGSDYRSLFSQGATFSPRVVFIVANDEGSPLGTPAGLARIRSHRSATEKEPWKSQPDLTGVVEEPFIRPVHSGETILPYHAIEPLRAVIPADGEDLLDVGDPKLDVYPGLARWWREAVRVWSENRSSDRLTLMEQLDYRGKLARQLGAPRDRVLYSASGMHMVAARVSDPNVIVSKSLYWAPVASEMEALYLCAVLNSAALTQAVRPLMAYGKDERHFDKYVWQLGLPTYDPDSKLHQEVAELGGTLEQFVAGLDVVDTSMYFVTARRRVRDALTENGDAQRLEGLVAELLQVAADEDGV